MVCHVTEVISANHTKPHDCQVDKSGDQTHADFFESMNEERDKQNQARLRRPSAQCRLYGNAATWTSAKVRNRPASFQRHELKEMRFTIFHASAPVI